MMRLALASLACAAILGSGLAAGALAQSRSRPAPRTHDSEQDALPPSVPPPVSTLSPTRGISGPRLEPGAVLCGSQEDLQHRAEVNRLRVDGAPDAGDPLTGCRLLNQERGVEVLSRPSMGIVEVKVKPSGEVAWTDAYLR